MRRVWFFLILALLTGCGNAPSEQYYFDNYDYSSLTGKSWSSSDFPLIIQVPDNFLPFKDAVNSAADRWNQALGETVFIFQFNGTPNTQWISPTDSVKDNSLNLFQQFNWSFPTIGGGVLAYTASLTQGTKIKQADIIFNFDFYNFADASNPYPQFNGDFIDFESVLVHELGHFLGLPHVSLVEDAHSVMLPTLRKGESRRELSTADIEKIRNIYLRL